MKNLSFKAWLVASLIIAASAQAETIDPNFSAKEILSEQEVKFSPAEKKGLVAVFLSAHCPCSNSHVAALKELHDAYPEFSFVGVHANADEGKDFTQNYFKQAALPFPMVQDTGAKLADRFHALKTPHAFVLSPQGEVLYKGGVSDSRDFAKAKHPYLAEALADIKAGKPVRTASSRSLGCTIARGGKDVW
ncbi:MAG: redoxin domain-containing protein [Proteobacteria bacterium]|nr:MAG: redoxin domain-containing protein [Pseudomonadota bacterium]